MGKGNEVWSRRGKGHRRAMTGERLLVGGEAALTEVLRRKRPAGQGAVLVTGGAGFLGSTALRLARAAGWDTLGTWREKPLEGGLHVDLSSADGLTRLRSQALSAILHTAASTNAEVAEREPEVAQRDNVAATGTLVALARERGVPLVMLSTDLVFDEREAPWRPAEPPCPRSVYGRTKVEAEALVLAYERGAVVRTSLITGWPADVTRSFPAQVVAACREGREMRLFTDEWRCPLPVELVAAGSLELLSSVAEMATPRVLHLSASTPCARWEFATRLAERLGLEGCRFTPALQSSVTFRAHRPARLALDTSETERRIETPCLPWEQGVEWLARTYGRRHD
jgi:dTDP-4-dehydrorhamnose reductase